VTVIRPACAEDLDRCELILNHAKENLRGQDLTQWQWGYPNRGNIDRDFAAGNLYVAYDEQTGEVMGAAAIILTGEPNYDDPLRGSWFAPCPNDERATYACIHRVTCAPEHQGKGIATALMNECERLARAAGKRSCRVETHPHNAGMRHVAEKLGYVHCCDIASRFDQIHGRVAYEKLLDPGDPGDRPVEPLPDDVDELQRLSAEFWATHMQKK
jgi:GNAT superfamily N-acetyltransferase